MSVAPIAAPRITWDDEGNPSLQVPELPTSLEGLSQEVKDTVLAYRAHDYFFNAGYMPKVDANFKIVGYHPTLMTPKRQRTFYARLARQHAKALKTAERELKKAAKPMKAMPAKPKRARKATVSAASSKASKARKGTSSSSSVTKAKA